VGGPFLGTNLSYRQQTASGFISGKILLSLFDSIDFKCIVHFTVITILASSIGHGITSKSRY
jgi:hypothetical protein